MPNILVRGHMRFDDSDHTDTIHNFVNNMANCDENANESNRELNEEMVFFLNILSNRINELDNLTKIDDTELKEILNNDSRIMMKKILSRYIGLLKKMNLSFDNLLE